MIHDGVDNILDGLRNLIDDYSEWLNKEELKEIVKLHILFLKRLILELMKQII